VQLSPLIDTNLCPQILPNGSLVGLLRNDDDRGSLHVVTASNWRDPHSYVQHGAQSHPIQPVKEDADIWMDERGGFHAISHSFDACGYHSFSRDGWNWSFAPVVAGNDSMCAFTYTVAYEDGTEQSFARRERPHIVMGSDGVTPVALTTAVTYGTADASYTHLQPIGTRAQGGAEPIGTRAPGGAARGAPVKHSAVSRAHREQQPRVPANTISSGSGSALEAASGGCKDGGGNDFVLARGLQRTAYLSRTGLEGLTSYTDSHGNVSSCVHDDFLLELELTGGKRLQLASAMDTDSRRKNCALMAAGCASPGTASFVYRCVADVQVTVLYEMDPHRPFVSKSLQPCMLRAEGGGPKKCDEAAHMRVVREVVWDGPCAQRPGS
jgi:hypothetical protein